MSKTTSLGDGTGAAMPRLPTAIIVGALFVLTAVAFMRTPLLPEIGDDLQLSAVQIGVVSSAFGVGRIVTNIPAGTMVDARPASVGLLAATLLMAIGTGLLAVTSSFAVLILAVFVMGSSSALMATTAMTTLTREAPPGRRGAAMALYATGLQTGQMLGPGVAGLAAGALTWRLTHALGAVLILALTAVVLVARWRLGPSLGTGGPGSPPAVRAALDEQVDARMSRQEMVAVSAVAFGVFFAMASLTNTLMPLFAAHEIDLSTQAIGIGLAFAGLSRVVGANVCGRIADRISRKAALIPSLVVLAGSALALALPLSAGSWFASLIVFSLASSGVAIAGTVIGDRSDRRTMGRRMGVYRTTGDVGTFLGPLAGAALYQYAGREAAAIMVGLLVLAVAVFAQIAIRESYPGRS